MYSKKFKTLSINSCLQNGKQNISLAENRDSSELTAILKGARQGIHNWKKENICCRRHSFITINFWWLGRGNRAQETQREFWDSSTFLYWYRCVNATAAGLGYLQVSVDCPCKFSPWALDSVRTVKHPLRKNGTIPLMTLILNTITTIQLQNKQA